MIKGILSKGKSHSRKMISEYDKMYSNFNYYREYWEGKVSVVYKLPKYLGIIEQNVFQKDKNISILELGAGDGEITSILFEKKKNNIQKYVALDLSSMGVMRIKDKIKNKKLFVVQADASTLPFGDQSFSVVISIDAMHHVFHPKKMAEEMIRVSKSKVFLIESNGLCLVRRLLERKKRYKSTNEQSYFPWEYKDFFFQKNVTQFKIKPFLFMVPHIYPVFIPINIAISEIMEKIPLIRWQCSGVIISVEKN